MKNIKLSLTKSLPKIQEPQTRKSISKRLFSSYLPVLKMNFKPSEKRNLFVSTTSSLSSSQKRSFCWVTQPIETGKTFYDFEVLDKNEKVVPLSEFKGKVILVVNVASRCGYTRQYPGLEKLHNKFKDNNFTVLGFPCNQFDGFEPGTNEEIQQFLATFYTPPITFPVMAKIEVNGENSVPLYSWLREVVGVKEIEWNFEKYLINQEGKIAAHYLSAVKADAIANDVDKLLNPPQPKPVVTDDEAAQLEPAQATT